MAELVKVILTDPNEWVDYIRENALQRYKSAIIVSATIRLPTGQPFLNTFVVRWSQNFIEES